MALLKKKQRRKLSKKVIKLVLKHGESLLVALVTGAANGITQVAATDKPAATRPPRSGARKK